MAWQPSTQIPDTRLVAQNLLDYIEANQASAFRWANEGGLLKPFAAIYNSASGRVIDVYPSLLVASDTFRKDLREGTHETAWAVRLEIAIEGSDAESLTLEARKYEYAVSSMLAQCADSGELTSGSDNLTDCIFDGLSPSFDELGTGVQSKYAQVTYITAQFRFYSGS